MTFYHYAGVNLSAGAVNVAKPIVFEFTGESLRVWYVERDTEKTLFLKDVTSPLYTRRLLKQDLNCELDYRGRLFSFDRDICIRKALERVERDRNALARLELRVAEGIEQAKSCRGYRAS